MKPGDVVEWRDLWGLGRPRHGVVDRVVRGRVYVRSWQVNGRGRPKVREVEAWFESDEIDRLRIVVPAPEASAP